MHGLLPHSVSKVAHAVQRKRANPVCVRFVRWPFRDGIADRVTLTLKLQIRRDESFENFREIGGLRSVRKVSARCPGQKVSNQGNYALRWVFVFGQVKPRAGTPSTAAPNPRTTNAGSVFATVSGVLVAEMMSFGYTCKCGLWASCSESVVFWKTIIQTSVRLN